MKDRFVKIMLVVIAGLLFLNCVKDNGSGGVSIPFLETKARATVPPFIQVGKSYVCEGVVGISSIASSGGQNIEIYENYKITQIDSNSGWIEAQNASEKIWVNSANLANCQESKPKVSN
jgi:hypothetical protein